MKRIIYQRNRLTTAQKLKKGLMQPKKLVADFISDLYRLFLFMKLMILLKNWPENIKLNLTIAAIENE